LRCRRKGFDENGIKSFREWCKPRAGAWSKGRDFSDNSFLWGAGLKSVDLAERGRNARERLSEPLIEASRTNANSALYHENPLPTVTMSWFQNTAVNNEADLWIITGLSAPRVELGAIKRMTALTNEGRFSGTVTAR